MERSLLLFQHSVKSRDTFTEYHKRLVLFKKYTECKTFDELSRIDAKDLQAILENYIISLKNKMNPNGIPVHFYAVKSFLEVNDVDLRWKKITRLFPQKVKKTGRKAYSTKQIQHLLSTSKELRTQAIIHFLSSSGVRVGALSDLKIRHLVEMPLGCKAVCVYEDSIEEYWTFLTPEAVKALDRYLNSRRTEGEQIIPESPLFRDYKFNLQNPVKAMSQRAIITVMSRAVLRSGIRTNKKNGRWDEMCNHAFRKRFLTILKSIPEIKNSTAEKLAGHKVYRDEENNIVDLDDSYNVPTLEKLFEQFKYAIPELTIDDMSRVQIKEMQIQKQYSALEQERQKHFEEKKRWYKTILKRTETEKAIPDWLRPIMNELIQDFES